MTIDLVLPAYAAKKGRLQAPPKGSQFVFNRPVIHTARSERGKLHEMVKNMRHDTYKRKEHYDKQLAHFLRKQRYQQQQTWQANHDRLRAQEMGLEGEAMEQHRERLDRLHALLATRGVA